MRWSSYHYEANGEKVEEERWREESFSGELLPVACGISWTIRFMLQTWEILLRCCQEEFLMASFDCSTVPVFHGTDLWNKCWCGSPTWGNPGVRWGMCCHSLLRNTTTSLFFKLVVFHLESLVLFAVTLVHVLQPACWYPHVIKLAQIYLTLYF